MNPTRGRGPSLLVVDDSRLIRKMVEEHFVARGYRVVEAADGVEALRKLSEARADVIVSDVLMPNMDGWQLYEAVRADPALRGVPFVFLTVERDLSQRLRGFRAGADDYVTKPFEVEELHARVDRLVARRGVPSRPILAGTVEHLALADLVQILSMNGRDCVVHMEQDALEGQIHFVDGVLVHAIAGPARGVKALYRLLAWEHASFRVEQTAPRAPERSIRGETSNVVMEGLVALDEWNRWRERLPAPSTVLNLADDARTRLEGVRVRPAEFEVLTRSKNGSNVAQILDESPMPDGQVAEAIHMLIERGIVHPRA